MNKGFLKMEKQWDEVMRQQHIVLVSSNKKEIIPALVFVNTNVIIVHFLQRSILIELVMKNAKYYECECDSNKKQCLQ